MLSGSVTISLINFLRNNEIYFEFFLYSILNGYIYFYFACFYYKAILAIEGIVFDNNFSIFLLKPYLADICSGNQTLEIH